jgi:hypothetical protein
LDQLGIFLRQGKGVPIQLLDSQKSLAVRDPVHDLPQIQTHGFSPPYLTIAKDFSTLTYYSRREGGWQYKFAHEKTFGFMHKILGEKPSSYGRYERKGPFETHLMET